MTKNDPIASQILQLFHTKRRNKAITQLPTRILASKKTIAKTNTKGFRCKELLSYDENYFVKSLADKEKWLTS